MLNGYETTGFKRIRDGWLWPVEDTECAAVVFDWLSDLDVAYPHIKNWQVCVQAGGNMGVWPKALARKFQKVYTFEPEPRNFYCLVHNCPEPQILKFNCGLGETRKLASMGYEGSNMGACYIRDGADFPILRVDDLPLSACDFIQFDLEGYDYFAIQGAEQTIKRFKPVIMVEDKGLSKKYGVEQGAVISHLESWGYRVAAKPHRDVILAPGD